MGSDFKIGFNGNSLEFTNVPEVLQTPEMTKEFINAISAHDTQVNKNVNLAIGGLLTIAGGLFAYLGIKTLFNLNLDQIESLDVQKRYEYIKKLNKEELKKLCTDKESEKRLGKTLKECLEVLQITEEQKQTDLKEFYEFMKEFNETHKENW